MPTSSNVTKLFDKGTYIVRMTVTDQITFIVEAPSKQHAEILCSDKANAVESFLPEEAVSSRRIKQEIRQVSRINPGQITGDE